MTAAFFWIFAVVVVLGAVGVVAMRQPVHSALCLLMSFLGVAALFVIAHAEFLAAVQVLVYAGGIMVLFLFVILLVETPGREPARRRRRFHVAASLVLTGLVLAILAAHFVRGGEPTPAARASLGSAGGNIETVAVALFRSYLLPFEIVSILLLVALVGAIVLARSKA